MSDKSIFTDKSQIPTENDLVMHLKDTFDLWVRIRDRVMQQYPAAKQEWNFSGEKYGWSFRIKDKKRAIIYLLPRDQYFKVAFVFGQKAYDQIMVTDIIDQIKQELELAKKYAEGRGIRINVHDAAVLSDIFKLIEIKLAN